MEFRSRWDQHPGEGLSDFIASFDNRFGAGPGGSDLTQRPWFQYFDASFNRYAELSGLSYAYEPNDDGAAHNGVGGSLGVRGDVRIAGNFIDGPSNVLAYNFFPNDGDMVMDTADMASFGSASNDYRFLRNVVMHEHGHGTGFSHVESSQVRLLMEPFIQTNFDGPQLDDVRGLHRGYGDFYEKSNGGAGNNRAANATDLGVVVDGGSAEIGIDGRGTNRVFSTQTDYVSIDDNSDIDFYAFTVDSASTVDVTMNPLGPTYLIGPQNGNQSTFNAMTRSNLALALFDTNQSTILASANAGGLGDSEFISFDVSSPGEYYVRVTGSANDIQLYDLTVSATSLTSPVTGDFDGNGLFECADVDDLVSRIASGSTDLAYDMNGDTFIDGGDLTEWLAVAGAENLVSGNSYVVGDANLDGTVDGQDFLSWNANKFTVTPAWCSGDFTADGQVDGLDFLVWNANKFLSADVLQAVPEPASMLLMFLAAGLLRLRRS